MKRWIGYGIFLVAIPAVVLGGVFLFRDRQYAWISLCVALLSCVPLFLTFEKSPENAKRLTLIAALTALSVAGRLIFAPLPGFKPVTAFVVITALYFGGEAGFLTGAMTAVLSNFYFGQGPWTPFQMLVWGLIGLFAGLAARPLKRSRLALAGYGVLSGALFSVLMDVWTVLWEDGTFLFSRYLAALVSSLPFTAIYAVSNVVFLLALSGPIGKVMERIKGKYGV